MIGRIELVTYGKTRAQRLDMIRKAVAEIAKLAVQLGFPVAAEKLDLRRKRAELETTVGKKRSRMLSSFIYSSFGEALARICIRKSVRLIVVNPAYTSLIGCVKFAPRYGSSVHAAAAWRSPVGRWPFPNDCRLPASPFRRFSPPATASPSRDLQVARRHVWSSYGRPNRRQGRPFFTVVACNFVATLAVSAEVLMLGAERGSYLG
ncbi:IS200/IS605 family element transposase accessory protein TnpB [Bradyrhizobium vignae]|uniref:Uncharacterized protein n=1 Tax=Bradyrhizobium vignae TaxID=1549949 RepID=A0A2U3PUY2_9BRAD|nr:IS200/IS605 family element transposase accessory protein TnpB [Bradyrhizobium vignae]SPP92934.1 protein of unknown function [Bradyrhizobium vignae]